MTTILEYQGGMEKWFIDTSIELQKRYPDLHITIVTRDNNFTEKIAKLLSFLGRYKFDKSIIYKQSYQDIIQKLGNIQYKKANSFKEVRKLFKEFDIVYSKNEILEAFIFKFIVGYKNIKNLIFGCHTALYYPVGRGMHNILYTTKIYNFLTSGVNRFHVLNVTDEAILQKLGKKVVKISNPINTEKIDKNAKNNQFPYKISKDLYNIGWIGRLTTQKGIDRLQYIIETVVDKYSKKIQIHIAGDGEEREKILELVKKYPFVKYYGHIDNKYIPNFLIQMNLFLLTSRGEGYPLSILEANVKNIPVLAFDIPGPRDIIEDGKNGFLVKDIFNYSNLLEKFITRDIIITSSREFILKKINDDVIYFQLYSLITKYE